MSHTPLLISPLLRHCRKTFLSCQTDWPPRLITPKEHRCNRPCRSRISDVIHQPHTTFMDRSVQGHALHIRNPPAFPRYGLSLHTQNMKHTVDKHDSDASCNKSWAYSKTNMETWNRHVQASPQGILGTLCGQHFDKHAIIRLPNCTTSFVILQPRKAATAVVRTIHPAQPCIHCSQRSMQNPRQLLCEKGPDSHSC